MANGPVDVSGRGTVVPRPGIQCNLVLVYEPRDPHSMPSLGGVEEMRVANLESAINERFAEPEEMGDVAITFRSDVKIVAGPFIQVKTTTRFMGPETMDEMRDIVERELGTPIDFFQITTEVRRKDLGMDFL